MKSIKFLFMVLFLFGCESQYKLESIKDASYPGRVLVNLLCHNDTMLNHVGNISVGAYCLNNNAGSMTTFCYLDLVWPSENKIITTVEAQDFTIEMRVDSKTIELEHPYIMGNVMFIDITPKMLLDISYSNNARIFIDSLDAEITNGCKLHIGKLINRVNREVIERDGLM